MTAPGRCFAGLAMGAALLAAAAPVAAQTTVAQATVVQAPPVEARHAYVDGFCLPIAGGYVDDDYAKFLGDWHARPGSSNEALAAQPQDALAPGQYVHLPDGAAPAVIVDPRRDVCSLIWPHATPSAEALAELARDKPPVGLNGAATPWRRIVPAPRVGPSRSPRFILLVRGAADRGVCAERLDDLRRHDGGVISMLQISSCRLADGEKVADGPG